MKLLTQLLFPLLVVSVAYAKSSISGITLKDAYSQSHISTDPSHWFLIDININIEPYSKDYLYFKVDDSFDSFPETPFTVNYGSQAVGKVQKDHGTNSFIVDLSGVTTQNGSTSFNFLAKLNSETEGSIQSPTTKGFNFTTTNSSFNSTIEFLAKDLNQMSTNGGIYESNSTAWFVADIPVQLLQNSVNFTSFPSSNNYKFNPKLSTYEIVIKTDSFGNPIKSVPFTALKDNSDENGISININTRVSGGKYLRIKYFSQPLSSFSISNTANLINDSSSLNLIKRDTTFNSDLYLQSQSNIENNTGTQNNITETNSLYAISSQQVIYQNLTIGTYKVSSTTQSAQVTEFGTYIAIATLKNSTSLKPLSTSGPSFIPASSTNTTSSKLTKSHSSSIISTALSGNFNLEFFEAYRESSSSSYLTETTPLPVIATLGTNVSNSSLNASSILISSVPTRLSSTDNSNYLKSTTTLSSSDILLSVNSLGSESTNINTTYIATVTPCIYCSSRINSTTRTEVLTDDIVSEVTGTKAAIVTTYHSLIPVATVRNFTAKTQTSISNSTSHLSSTDSPIIDLQFLEGTYEYVSISTRSEIRSTFGSLIPVATLSSNLSSTTQNSIIINTVTSCAHNTTTPINSAELIEETLNGTFTSTQSEVDDIIGTLIPVSTLKNNISRTTMTKYKTNTKTMTSCTACAKVTSEYDEVISDSLSSYTNAESKRVITNLIPVSTLRSQLPTPYKNLTSSIQTLVGYSEITTSLAPKITTINSLLGNSTISTNHFIKIQSTSTHLEVQNYEAGSNRIGVMTSVIMLGFTMFFF